MPIRLTVGVRAILIACFVLFIVLQTSDQFFGTHLFEVLALVPSAVTRELRVWQLFTYSFVHRDITHLFFNLLMLAFIGSELELVWGKRKFLKYYFFCATSAALIYWLLGSFVFPGSGYHPMAGSSGAIYGLLLAYGVLFGDRVLLFMMLFPMKAKHFVAVLALLELLTTLYSSGGGACQSFSVGSNGVWICLSCLSSPPGPPASWKTQATEEEKVKSPQIDHQ